LEHGTLLWLEEGELPIKDKIQLEIALYTPQIPLLGSF
jgi:hypothetical protein